MATDKRQCKRCGREIATHEAIRCAAREAQRAGMPMPSELVFAAYGLCSVECEAEQAQADTLARFRAGVVS